MLRKPAENETAGLLEQVEMLAIAQVPTESKTQLPDSSERFSQKPASQAFEY